ncbi:MAG: alanine--tRNA ligase, partial [Proteobacteria bacterium]
TLAEGQSGLLVMNRTPFYAEGGGQVGDQGVIKGENGTFVVNNCLKNGDIYIHHVEVESGQFKLNDNVETHVSESTRRNTMANHSATHLMHSALRKVLGVHVSQAGSLVDPMRTRFDFTHNKSMTAEEIQTVESIVNAEISKSHPVKAETMKHKEAISRGAMALFGEKYGDDVRVLSMGEFSSELCGGTHVTNTSQIRMFKVISESGVSAGVRRIEAVTGDLAVQYALYGIQQTQQARAAAGLDSAWAHFNALASASQSVGTLELSNIKINANERSGIGGSVDDRNNVITGTTPGAQSVATPGGQSVATPGGQSLDAWIEAKKTELRTLEREIKKLQGSQINIDEIAGKAKSFTSKTGAAKLVLADVALDDREVLA